MTTRLQDAQRLLTEERKELEERLAHINAALESLSGTESTDGASVTPAPKVERPKSTPRARTRRTRKWSKAELTCPECKFVATAPQGLAAHIRNKHPESQAQQSEQAEETAEAAAS